MDEKSQQQSQSDAPSGGFMQDTPPRADVDEILRRKRKAREYKVSTSAQVSLICLFFTKFGQITRRIETSSLRRHILPHGVY
jgi:hypothetical protein